MTVFPGIQVMRIDTQESLTQKDSSEDSFIDDVAESITPGQIQKTLGDRDKVVYTLLVSATTKRAAMIKARGFVRAKNPFEIGRVDIIDVFDPDENLVVNSYTITVGVAKEGVLN